MRKTILFLILIFFLISITGHATYSSISYLPRTIESMQRNPGLLGATPYSFEFQINPVAAGLGNNSWTAYQILDHMNEHWDQETKEEILGSIPDDGFNFGVDQKSDLFLGGGSWGLQAGLRSNANLNLDKQIFEILLEGTDIELEVDLQNTYAKGSLIANSGVSKAFSIERIAEWVNWESFYLGTGLNYLYGLAWVDAKAVGEAQLNYEEDDTSLTGEAQIEMLYSHIMEDGGGQGFAVDVGIWGQPTSRLSIGLSLTNMGMIEWSGVYRSQLEGEFVLEHPLLIEED